MRDALDRLLLGIFLVWLLIVGIAVLSMCGHMSVGLPNPALREGAGDQ
jgi:hypothetical protein